MSKNNWVFLQLSGVNGNVGASAIGRSPTAANNLNI